jgi:hypothetical protein
MFHRHMIAYSLNRNCIPSLSYTASQFLKLGLRGVYEYIVPVLFKPLIAFCEVICNLFSQDS